MTHPPVKYRLHIRPGSPDDDAWSRFVSRAGSDGVKPADLFRAFMYAYANDENSISLPPTKWLQRSDDKI